MDWWQNVDALDLAKFGMDLFNQGNYGKAYSNANGVRHVFCRYSTMAMLGG